ncbi:hypothetical protein SynBIOSE41_03801 [Synechococcus sp. BIOS-E4-1]|nr:hypothetical protein SynBIOSE41_03801 [Synechococcus sp. BIOS-E4-1]
MSQPDQAYTLKPPALTGVFYCKSPLKAHQSAFNTWHD